MADDEEAVSSVACTSLVFCALSVYTCTQKRRHAVWVKDYLKKRDFWVLLFSSDVRLNESQSDLVKLHAHRHRTVWGTF